MGLIIQRLENRVVGKPPKKLQGKPQQDDGEFDEVDQGDYPSGTIFGADGQCGHPVKWEDSGGGTQVG